MERLAVQGGVFFVKHRLACQHASLVSGHPQTIFLSPVLAPNACMRSRNRETSHNSTQQVDVPSTSQIVHAARFKRSVDLTGGDLAGAC